MSAHFLSEGLRRLKCDFGRFAEDDALAGHVAADIQGRIDHYIRLAFSMELELAVFRLIERDRAARTEAKQQAADFMASTILSAKDNVVRPKFGERR